MAAASPGGSGPRGQATRWAARMWRTASGSSTVGDHAPSPPQFGQANRSIATVVASGPFRSGAPWSFSVGSLILEPRLGRSQEVEATTSNRTSNRPTVSRALPVGVTNHLPGAFVQTLQLRAHTDGGGNVGAARTADGGENWRMVTKGLYARYPPAVAVDGETVLVSASSGPGGRRAAIYRTRADGHGDRCRQGLPEWLGDNVDTHCLAARSLTVVVGTGEGRVYVSPDGGESFALLTKGLPAIQCVALG
jgi:hypothetical protein